jgi:trehalose 6-phosphate synthase/phosphatase
VPIWYLYRFLPFNNLIALYNVSDVALVTPLKDGMNLIAKEFIATKTDGRGVLILSEITGAAKELSEAIIVNPNNKEKIADALKEALTMPEQEQIEHNRAMQSRLERYNILRWVSDFMDSLSNIKKIQKELYAKKITHKQKEKLIVDYRKSNRRLLFLDYDGTLVPFGEKPERVKPDAGLIKLLGSLTCDNKNEVVIISGRNKESLEEWFSGLDVRLIAEHGAWIRKREGNWETIEPTRNDWKQKIKPIFELYADRTPGSFVEEKDFSLVWHYRKVEPELALVRAKELQDNVLHLTSNLNLGVLEGNKVIEIKKVGINKGRATLRWTRNKKWDFILAVGDDWTDEDMFTSLPEATYSIKVGTGSSRAKFNLDSVGEIRLLLKELGR